MGTSRPSASPRELKVVLIRCQRGINLVINLAARSGRAQAEKPHLMVGSAIRVLPQLADYRPNPNGFARNAVIYPLLASAVICVVRRDHMSIRVADILPKPGLQFLALCDPFVTVEWQHANREAIPDQGFERRCRERCVIGLQR